ncbi:MAG: hypothetical protein COC09_09645 [Gammaproteobacteria bacterium]|nr:hypothetical protein [Gammaproteobacteria bacterium]PCH62091.1 MAG: hypothetical protein COC09_09645 [Gammaproteobacteria bacterium]
MATKDLSGRSAARARRDAQVYGKASLPAKAGATAGSSAVHSTTTRSVSFASTSTSGSCRQESLARRRQMSTKGKAGVVAADRIRSAGNKSASVTATVDKGCGCKGKESVAPTATAVPVKPSMLIRTKEIATVSPGSKGRMNSRLRRRALATHGKKGVDIFNTGVSSAQMARQQDPDISSRDLARSIRSQRSTNGGSKSVTKATPVRAIRPRLTSEEVTGTQVAHSANTTGDETGLCRSVTGTHYLSDDVFADYCQKGDNKFSVPPKVVTSALARGGNITTASSVGRSDSVTGNEQGSCKNVTGTEYLGTEQFEQFCGAKPAAGPAKISFSQTSRGKIVSGSKPARSEYVTGDEAGTCKAVTGTPYAGVEQYQNYCTDNQAEMALARNEIRRGNAGRDITGIQPGLSNLTGADKGICKPLTGTAYVGAKEQQAVCGAAPAQLGEPDFPKPLTGAPWGDFSVAPPSHVSQAVATDSGVTGVSSTKNRISGTFSLGEGKLTGTDDARFGDLSNTGNANAPTVIAKSGRGVTGEGLDLAMNITGDDWDRGDRVTGTEGSSAIKRNPTIRGPVNAMPGTRAKRNDDVKVSDISVTGGSGGNSDHGAQITLSGGARG